MSMSGSQVTKAQSSNLVIRAFRWLQLYPSALSCKLFSHGIQEQDLDSLEVLAEGCSNLCPAEDDILIGHEPCNAPNVHIEDLRGLLEPARSITMYQGDREIYNSGCMLSFQSFHSDRIRSSSSRQYTAFGGTPVVHLSSISQSLH